MTTDRSAHLKDQAYRQEASRIQTQLDGQVMDVELTLMSIIQGVALTFLADAAREPLVNFEFAFWPYVATGLLTILLFWSRSLIHTLTVIRWPLELSHNFMYIACTLVETVTFTVLDKPFLWFVFHTLFGILVWLLFLLDLRMIRRRIADSPGPAGNRLYAVVEKEQLAHIRFLIPLTVAFNLGAAAAIRLYPSLVLEEGHVFLGLAQFAAAAGYLAYVMRLFVRIRPMIAATHQEWRDDVLT